MSNRLVAGRARFARRALLPALGALMLGLGAGAAGLAAVALTPATAQAASADPAAEAFIQTQAQRALDILSKNHGDPAEEKRQFRAFVDQVADVPRVTNFVLGKYARTITPEQKQAFAPVFREYASNVYESRLSEYHGETLKVVGSMARTPTDIIVSSLVVGGRQPKPVPVQWRVLNEDGAWKVVDVQVSGVWLAITQQQDFVSTIDNAGGDVNVLINRMQRDLAGARGGRGARGR
jgi:phospholipid transport system substrate-binding protein